mmetsp:Transcript_510/g.1259  ORF Transcript_510/g.1259 Transcript_510/m.1259 type:complete len:230 (+) Transcript_510:709-1398(+)
MVETAEMAEMDPTTVEMRSSILLWRTLLRHLCARMLSGRGTSTNAVRMTSQISAEMHRWRSLRTSKGPMSARFATWAHSLTALFAVSRETAAEVAEAVVAEDAGSMAVDATAMTNVSVEDTAMTVAMTAMTAAEDMNAVDMTVAMIAATMTVVDMTAAMTDMMTVTTTAATMIVVDMTVVTMIALVAAIVMTADTTTAMPAMPVMPASPVKTVKPVKLASPVATATKKT